MYLKNQNTKSHILYDYNHTLVEFGFESTILIFNSTEVTHVENIEAGLLAWETFITRYGENLTKVVFCINIF